MCRVSQQTAVKFTQDRACPAIQKSSMTILARLSVGRILLHLIAMLGDRSVRFHFEGIARELPWIASGLAMLTRAPKPPCAAQDTREPLGYDLAHSQRGSP